MDFLKTFFKSSCTKKVSIFELMTVVYNKDIGIFHSKRRPRVGIFYFSFDLSSKSHVLNCYPETYCEYFLSLLLFTRFLCL